MFIEEEDYHIENTWYKTLIKYYPTRFKVNGIYDKNRQVVFNFKDGIRNQSVINGFVDAIIRIKAANPNHNFWLATIPASTIQKQYSRFYKFCEEVSLASKINNGYSLIQCSGNRNPVHAGENRNYENIISSIIFGDVDNKDIILCDDVATSGRSFSILTNHLISLGSRSVIGVMLAKTHWPLEEQEF
jgi:phosphoribosylpyrophosphate synthetase